MSGSSEPGSDQPDVRYMPGPVRPPWGELDAVVRAVIAAGGDLDAVLEAADQVALEEDLDPRRAEARARALHEDDPSDAEFIEEQDA